MTSVLVVEDSLAQSTQIRLMLKNAEFEVYLAENGREALEVLKSHQPEIVLTDLQMPEMDGLQLVKAIGASHPHLPVVLMTQHGSEEIALDALRQGAASYLPKSQLHQHMVPLLDDILESARSAYREELIQQRRFRTEIQYRLENDPGLIGPLSGQIEQELDDQHFANPTIRRQLGVALRKALNNAIFHGNLELTEDDRANGELAYRDLAEQRRKKRPWCRRSVWVTVVIDEGEARFIVRDEGPGFDVSAATASAGSVNLDELHGSGLLLIRTFMDHVEHNSLGNEITMIKHRPPPEDSIAETSAPFRRNQVFALESIEDTLVVTIQTENAGFVDQGLSADLDAVYRILADSEIHHVLVDFSQIEYFSSSILEALRNIWLQVKRRGGKMALCCLSPGGREILHLSRFDTIWTTHNSQSEALTALHQKGGE